MGGASVYTILQQKSQKKTERGKKEQNSSHTNKKLIGAHGSQMKKINLGWVSGGALLSSIIVSSIGENFGA